MAVIPLCVLLNKLHLFSLTHHKFISLFLSLSLIHDTT